MMAYDYPHPVSRTYQYKKITKPLLERKRRARINRCLDELKDLMMTALEAEGENISKLEKADILELTVRHLQRLHTFRPSGLSAGNNEDVTPESRWQSGFGHCAEEACRYLATIPGGSGKLARHLASGLQSSRRLNTQISSKNEDTSGRYPTNPSRINSPQYSETHEVSGNQETLDTMVMEASESSETVMEVRKSDGELISSQSVMLEKNDRSEDDEEIDIECVDDRRNSMWRPW